MPRRIQVVRNVQHCGIMYSSAGSRTRGRSRTHVAPSWLILSSCLAFRRRWLKAVMARSLPCSACSADVTSSLQPQVQALAVFRVPGVALASSLATGPGSCWFWCSWRRLGVKHNVEGRKPGVDVSGRRVCPGGHHLSLRRSSAYKALSFLRTWGDPYQGLCVML